MRWNSVKRGLWLFELILLGMTCPVVRANVETIQVHRGDVISKDISINPGFAVMFQFPEDVQALTLADQTAFACEKMPTDASRVLCKPLTQSQFATNLVVSTTANEYNIVLNVDPSGQKHAFKYVFTDGSRKPDLNEETLSHQQVSAYSVPSSNLMDLVLDHFEANSCRVKGENSVLRFRCLDIVELGTERFMRFSLSANTSGDVRIVKLVLSAESLGGLTGLAIADESNSDLAYSLKRESVGPGEESIGIVKLPSHGGEGGKRFSLVIMTDQGKMGDLRIYGF